MVLLICLIENQKFDEKYAGIVQWFILYPNLKYF